MLAVAARRSGASSARAAWRLAAAGPGWPIRCQAIARATWATADAGRSSTARRPPMRTDGVPFPFTPGGCLPHPARRQ